MAEDDKTRVRHNGSPHIVIRALWFILIGWELTAVWLAIAWILNITVIGLPIGLKMISLVPIVLTLKGKSITQTLNEDGQVISQKSPEQRSFLARAIYFIVIGWWASLVWTIVGYLFSISIIGLPIGIWMLNRLPEVTTLYRQK